MKAFKQAKKNGSKPPLIGNNAKENSSDTRQNNQPLNNRK